MTEAADRLWQALNELEAAVRAWEYPDAVRRIWAESGDEDTQRNVQAAAERNLERVRANMQEGIDLARGFLGADDEPSAMQVADRLVDRWERWTGQVSRQNAEALHAQRPWWDRWADELDEWTRQARDAAGRAADGLESAGRIGLALAAAGALYLLSRR